MLKIFISGKITGDRNYKEKFDNAKRALQGDGYIVLSPADLPLGMSREDYTRICFAMIDVCDQVIFLPDWKDSEGAMLEYNYCKYNKKEILGQ